MEGNQIRSRATVLGEDGQRVIITKPPVATGDFNGDGTADILFHNSETGEIRMWFMDGHRIASQATVLGEAGNVPVIEKPPVAAGDFNGDGKADILFHNDVTGEIQIWFMDGNQLRSRATVLGEDGRAVVIEKPPVAAGDFNGDGKADILFHNDVTGEIRIWFMDGHRIASQATVLGEAGNVPVIEKPPVAAGDFNGDGKADILFHNDVTSEIQIWFMDGNQLRSRATVLGEDGRPAFVGLPFSIATAGVARVMQEIALRFVGFHCFGTTSGPGPDEPYFVFGVVPTNVEQKPPATRTRIFEDVDPGESVGEIIDLYKGVPFGVAMSISLFEHDTGDPDEFKKQVERGMDRAAERVIEGLAHVPVFGVPLAVAGEIAFVFALPALVEAVNDLLGTADDHIRTERLPLTPMDMTRLARAERQDFHGIRAHLESPLISGDDASYKAYFDVVEV